MSIPNFHVNWVDFVLLLILAVGVIRGRKRGMSEEVLDLFKWVLIVVAAGHLYQPVGSMMASMTPFGSLAWYVTSYTCILLIIHGFFVMFRRAVGQKLVTSDAFGNGEYYMGMVAGAFRYFCVIIVALAFINARQYNPEDIKADEAAQENNFGSIRMPRFYRFQSAVFEGSCAGTMARKYLASYLIRPTLPEDKPLGGGQSIQGRERNLKDVLDKR